MYSWYPPNADVLILSDVRSLEDANRDANQTPTPNRATVLRHWVWGRAVWGAQWDSVARVAMFNPGTEVSEAMRAEAKAAVLALIVERRPRLIVVLQTQSQSARKVYNEDEAPAEHVGNICWQMFNPPDTINECSGTFLDTPYGRVLPVLNARNYDYVYGNVIQRWLEWARDGLQPLQLGEHYITPGTEMRSALKRILASARAGKAIMNDIENFTGSELITTVGFSDGDVTVSIPWHDFKPHGQTAWEYGAACKPEGDLAREITKAARIFMGHNCIAHDIPLLKGTGFEIPGAIFDTYLASGVSTNQYPHGLQRCVSYFIPAPPWKSLFRYSQRKATGSEPEMADYWISRPKELRAYNSGDCFYNYAVAPVYYYSVYGKDLP